MGMASSPSAAQPTLAWLASPGPFALQPIPLASVAPSVAPIPSLAPGPGLSPLPLQLLLTLDLDVVAPRHSMSRNSVTVLQLWEEWMVGENSIEQLNCRWGSD
jgi:hypothetical protein